MPRRSRLDGLLLLPTYWVYRLFRPYLNDAHPWKSPTISWRVWWDSSTDLNVTFGVGFWVFVIIIVVLLYRMIVPF